jgi:hypothetical protein
MNVEEGRPAKRSLPRILVLAVVFAALSSVLFFSQGALALAGTNSFTYHDFGSTQGLTLKGSAAQSGNVLRLTPARDGQVGAAWYDTTQSVKAGFSTTFRFQITNLAGGGADGFSFNVHNNGLDTLVGETGTSDDLSVQFDTYQNGGDPSDNFVRINYDGADVSTNTSPGINLSDGEVHTAAIDYADGTVNVSIDSRPIVSANDIDLASISPAVVGFGARTGGAHENHDILDWSFEANTAPVAKDQPVTTNEEEAKTITLTGTDADGDDLTFQIVDPPSKGTLGSIGPVTCAGTSPETCSADIAYTPDAGFVGTDSFTYKANDGKADSDTATVTITVRDATAPTVTEVAPSEGATKVSRTTNVTATFSEAMDPVTLTGSTFTLVNEKTGKTVDAPVTVSSDGKTATLDPSANLGKKTRYTAKISGAKDLAGNALPDYPWSFTTGKK